MTTDTLDIQTQKKRGEARKRDEEALLLLALLSFGDVEEATGYWRRLAPDRFKGVINARLAREGLPPEAVASASYPAYDRATLTYVDRMGDVLDPIEVRLAVLTVIDRAEREYAAATAAMMAGAATLEEWQEKQSTAVKQLHVALGAVGAGGAKQLTADQLTRSREHIPSKTDEIETLGDLIAFHLAKLQAFAIQIERESQSATGETAVVSRSRLYATSGYPTFEMLRRWAAGVAGMTQERNVLRPAEHCHAEPGSLVEDCPTQSAKGWVTIGELVPVGQRLCSFNCKCVTEYRRQK